MTRKNVFAAIVAYTEKITKDGRMLATPEDFHVRASGNGFPVPVLWTPPDKDGKPVPTIYAGLIREAYVIDKRLIVFGEINRTDRGPEVVDLLLSGSWFLEIDVDAGDMSYDLDPLLPELEQVPVGPVIFTGWKLRAAWVGTQPCWDLPPVQIQEIRA